MKFLFSTALASFLGCWAVLTAPAPQVGLYLSPLELFRRADSSTKTITSPLRREGTAPGKAVKVGTELRILGVGDSITVGYSSTDGNGYRLQLKNDLSKDKVNFVGTKIQGNMTDGRYAAWSGKTIKFVANNVGPSLKLQPNIILLHVGTNDMNPDKAVTKEDNDPATAAARLGDLIDLMIEALPDAVILVAMILGTCVKGQAEKTKQYQSLIPGVVQKRLDLGHHVLAVDFTTLPMNQLKDCVHPNDVGYREMGHYWYDFITQVPSDWIQDPDRKNTGGDKEGDRSNGCKAITIFRYIFSISGKAKETEGASRLVKLLCGS